MVFAEILLFMVKLEARVLHDLGSQSAQSEGVREGGNDVKRGRWGRQREMEDGQSKRERGGLRLKIAARC